MEKSKINGDTKNNEFNKNKSLNYKQSVYLRHRQNCKLEYNFNNKYLEFRAYERKKISKEILDCASFKKIEKNFIIERGE